MKTKRYFYIPLIIVVAMLFLPTATALAAPQADGVIPDILDAYTYVSEILGGLGFTMLLVGFVTNLLKRKYGDGKAGTIYNIVLASFLGLLTLLKLLIPDLDLVFVDDYARHIYDNFLIMFPTLMVIIKALSKPLYDAIRGIPLIGFSHSIEREKTLLGMNAKPAE